ncbi:MAG: hypothetical protein EOP36_02715 [Rubrivivax sp.]|nr:MAG: hypothetical protein EOP36_02715 [Rubrivivax sp.]
MARAPTRKPGTRGAQPLTSASAAGALRDHPGQDLVLAALARALLITLVDPDTAGSPLFTDQLLQALRLHLQERYGDPAKPRRPRRGA